MFNKIPGIKLVLSDSECGVWIVCRVKVLKAPYANLLGLWWFIIFGFKEMLLYVVAM